MSDQLYGVHAGKTTVPMGVAIQAGGESRRMGRSKATVPFLGEPLLQRIVTRVAPVASEIVISTNEPQNLGFLDRHPARARISLHRDACEKRGSLTGLVTAFTSATCQYLAVCACDMVFVSPELFAAELDALLATPEADAVIPRTAFGYEPFHGVYRRAQCLEALIDALEQGRTSIRSFLETLHVRDYSMEEVGAVVPAGLCFINANTPQELAHAQELALSVDGARGGVA